MRPRPQGSAAACRRHFLLRWATNGSGTLAQAPGNPPHPPRQKPPISLAPPSTWHWQQTGRHHPRSLETLVSRGKFHQKEKSHWEFSLGLLGFSCSTPRPSASPTASATIPSLTPHTTLPQPKHSFPLGGDQIRVPRSNPAQGWQQTVASIGHGQAGTFSRSPAPSQVLLGEPSPWGGLEEKLVIVNSHLVHPGA